MKVLVSGATGLVGKPLIASLTKKGHAVVALSRSVEKARKLFSASVQVHSWDGYSDLPSAALTGVDAVVHLAGEPVAEKRWSEAQKERIRMSRVLGTAAVARALATRPEIKTWVCASAIGIYGKGFLAGVCRDWEEQTKGFPGRLVQARIGMVLANEGGALPALLPVFRLGLGGPVGSGEQWVSWIHLDDLVSFFVWALESPNVKGVYDAVAPEPVTNKTFSEILGKVLGVPSFFRVPATALKLVLGGRSELVLESLRLTPDRAVQDGFVFRFSSLTPALEELCRKNT